MPRGNDLVAQVAVVSSKASQGWPYPLAHTALLFMGPTPDPQCSVVVLVLRNLPLAMSLLVSSHSDWVMPVHSIQSRHD